MQAVLSLALALSLGTPAALAAKPPSIDRPLETGDRARKDAAVLISMEDYSFLPDLPGVKADTEAMAAWLLKTRGLEEDRLTILRNSSAMEIAQTVKAAAGGVKGRGTLWVYFAGYGSTDAIGGRLLMGQGADPTDMGKDSVGLSSLISEVGASKAGQVVVVLDCNFGGYDRGGEVAFTIPAPPAAWATPASERVSVWAAAVGAETAPYYDEAGHGLFTWLVVGSLRGWADGAMSSVADGKVTLQEANQYLYKVYRQIGGPDLKPSREAREKPNAWVLTSASGLDPTLPAEFLVELAKVERAQRVEKAQTRLRQIADVDWVVAVKAMEAPGADVKAILSAFVARYDTATVVVDGAEVAVVIPQVADARARLDALARAADPKKKKKKKSRKKAPPPPVAPPPSLCDDLLSLQALAASGQMSTEHRQCLEVRLSSEPVQTNRDKISRLLLIDAEVRGDDEEWLTLAARHLEEIDRSDPDLCFKYALRLSRGGIEDAEDVLRWADVAMENKQVWEGPLYMSRTYNLLRLKAETAARLWNDAEADYIEEHIPENQEITDKYRGMARNFSREWLDYARSSGQPWDRAYDLCLSAAGSETSCPAE